MNRHSFFVLTDDLKILEERKDIMKVTRVTPFLVLGLVLSILTFIGAVQPSWAGEAELNIPILSKTQNSLLMFGLLICILGMIFGAYEYVKVRNLPAHKSMLDVAGVIFQTCKTYLIQQGKFLIILVLICISTKLTNGRWAEQ